MRSNEMKTTTMSRLAAYSAAAAATATAGSSAIAAEVVHDVPDVVITAGSDVFFNMVQGITAASTSGLNATGGLFGIKDDGFFNNYIYAYGGGRIAGAYLSGSSYPYAGRVGNNAAIDAGAGFLSATYAGFATAAGQAWEGGDQQGFVPLEFQIAGNTHYGWAEVLVADKDTLTLLAFGYNDVANTASTTPVPEPSSLALLALGAAGLASRRNRKTVA